MAHNPAKPASRRRRLKAPAFSATGATGHGRFDFIDVTLRDAHQCLWSTRMTTAMMTPVLAAIDRGRDETGEALVHARHQIDIPR